jgi:predicted TIM-barrel fold metal-dependent hydrolase
MQAQHLDPNNVAFGILNPLAPSGQGFRNLELGAAMTRAVNDWQVACWTSLDARLRASVLVPYEDPQASAAEIRARAGDRNFAQVLLLSRMSEPTGRRRYWPIFDAAVEAGLPVGIHAFGYGGHPITGGGWPSYYIEEMTGHAQASQAGLASLIFEGVFARHPTLKVVLIEAGFAWLPSFAWRMDRLWARMRAEVPHVKEKPSETIRRQVWLTTQPMEEPGDPAHLAEAIGWIGWDRLIFATDYPHWDFDDPAYAMPLRLDAATRERFFRENARAVWGD